MCCRRWLRPGFRRTTRSSPAPAVFVERCQNPDGGFFFSTVVLDANKAGQDGSHYRSYGTATADGILALQAMGAAPDDERVCSARRWLAAHDRPDGAPGFIGPAYQRWTTGLRFYYAGAATEAFGWMQPGAGRQPDRGAAARRKLAESGDAGEGGRSADRHGVRDFGAR